MNIIKCDEIIRNVFFFSICYSEPKSARAVRKGGLSLIGATVVITKVINGPRDTTVQPVCIHRPIYNMKDERMPGRRIPLDVVNYPRAATPTSSSLLLLSLHRLVYILITQTQASLVILDPVRKYY